MWKELMHAKQEVKKKTIHIQYYTYIIAPAYLRTGLRFLEDGDQLTNQTLSPETKYSGNLKT